MIEFDMIPDDESIENMNREYDKVLRRKELLNGVDDTVKVVSHRASPPCYGLKCGTGDLMEKKLFADIYHMQMDMVAQLKHLHTIAPYDMREEISNVIKIKRRDSKMILKCYYNTTDDVMTHSPTLSHDRNYCRLLRHIIANQQKLLIMLAGSHKQCVYIKRVISNELTAGYILNSMAIYCRR